MRDSSVSLLLRGRSHFCHPSWLFADKYPPRCGNPWVFFLPIKPPLLVLAGNSAGDAELSFHRFPHRRPPVRENVLSLLVLCYGLRSFTEPVWPKSTIGTGAILDFDVATTAAVFAFSSYTRHRGYAPYHVWPSLLKTAVLATCFLKKGRAVMLSLACLTGYEICRVNLDGNFPVLHPLP